MITIIIAITALLAVITLLGALEIIDVYLAVDLADWYLIPTIRIGKIDPQVYHDEDVPARYFFNLHILCWCLIVEKRVGEDNDFPYASY